MQREMYPTPLPALRWVDKQTVQQWTSWRDAVLWCWQNRGSGNGNEQGDQIMFRMYAMKFFGEKAHAPHISRWFNKDTDAPMDLPNRLAAAFESFTGWRGLSQWFNKTAQLTVLEELQARSA